MENRFFNAHTHIFTLQQVPDQFAKGYFSIFAKTISISWLRKVGALAWLIKTIPKLYRNKDDVSMAERLINLVKHGEERKDRPISQQAIFDTLRAYYPAKTAFIVLPMDMEYMGAGSIPEGYMTQIEQLEKIKLQAVYTDTFFPFLFADPRRFVADPEYLSFVKTKLGSGIFSGLKMYPALGYWPFDKNLKPLYDFCIQYNIPLMTHCAAGVVHSRSPRPKTFSTHPMNPDIRLQGKKPKHYTVHFSNPLSFHCLMDSKLLAAYWKVPEEEVSAYEKLKVCFSHFGGSSEWKRYLKIPWVPDRDDAESEGEFKSLQIKNWNYNLKPKDSDYSWFSIIREMMERYENVYADISFMLHDQETWPLLKVLLANKVLKFRTRVLFGTDFYVVAQMGSERELSLGLRAYLGEEFFMQIAKTNVENFLSTKIHEPTVES
ncbi:MAG: amidohydrolase family protein [Bacteroidales bacterium]|nr:amidohydrolase family protein [Bacteroidales bacterium]